MMSQSCFYTFMTRKGKSRKQTYLLFLFILRFVRRHHHQLLFLFNMNIGGNSHTNTFEGVSQFFSEFYVCERLHWRVRLFLGDGSMPLCSGDACQCSLYLCSLNNIFPKDEDIFHHTAFSKALIKV